MYRVTIFPDCQNKTFYFPLLSGILSCPVSGWAPQRAQGGGGVILGAEWWRARKGGGEGVKHFLSYQDFPIVSTHAGHPTENRTNHLFHQNDKMPGIFKSRLSWRNRMNGHLIYTCKGLFLGDQNKFNLYRPPLVLWVIVKVFKKNEGA